MQSQGNKENEEMLINLLHAGSSCISCMVEVGLQGYETCYSLDKFMPFVVWHPFRLR